VNFSIDATKIAGFIAQDLVSLSWIPRYFLNLPMGK